MRIAKNVERGKPLTIHVDGEALAGFVGETVAAIMIAAGKRNFRLDSQGRSRGLFCNMGTCCECTVEVGMGAGSVQLRACLLPAEEGQCITTGRSSK